MSCERHILTFRDVVDILQLRMLCAPTPRPSALYTDMNIPLEPIIPSKRSNHGESMGIIQLFGVVQFYMLTISLSLG